MINSSICKLNEIIDQENHLINMISHNNSSIKTIILTINRIGSNIIIKEVWILNNSIIKTKREVLVKIVFREIIIKAITIKILVINNMKLQGKMFKMGSMLQKELEISLMTLV